MQEVVCVIRRTRRPCNFSPCTPCLMKGYRKFHAKHNRIRQNRVLGREESHICQQIGRVWVYFIDQVVLRAVVIIRFVGRSFPVSPDNVCCNTLGSVYAQKKVFESHSPCSPAIRQASNKGENYELSKN